MANEIALSPEAAELLRRMKAHTSESLECCYRRIDDVAKEQTAQRRILERSHADVATLIERSKQHGERIKKVEVSEERVTRKVYALSGFQAAVFTLLHFIKGH